MNFLQKAYSWIGQSFRLTDPDPWRLLSGVSTPAGQTVGEESAMRLSVVWGCVRLLSETIGSLPLSIYETTKDISEWRGA